MKEGPKITAASTRSRKLLARLDDWVVSCLRIVHKHGTDKEKDLPGTRDSDVSLVTSLIEIVSDSFRAWFAPGTHLKASSDTFDYLDRVLDDLTATLGHTNRLQPDRLADRLHSVLLQLNFNARPYCFLFIAQITDRLSAKNTPEQKMDVLYEYLKMVMQLQCERGMMYYDLYPNVKEFIGGWIIEEISYLERKTARLDEQPQQPLGEYFDNGMPMKILLNTSVARLACITRALVERGIIQNSNVSDLSLLLSKLVITRRSENVSARAFRLRYYDIEDSTRSAVAKTLKELARHVETMGIS